MLWLLFSLGLPSHLLIAGKINSPLLPDRKQAILQFNVPDENDRLYSGTLAGINQQFKSGAWI